MTTTLAEDAKLTLRLTTGTVFRLFLKASWLLRKYIQVQLQLQVKETYNCFNALPEALSLFSNGGGYGAVLSKLFWPPCWQHSRSCSWDLHRSPGLTDFSPQWFYFFWYLFTWGPFFSLHLIQFLRLLTVSVAGREVHVLPVRRSPAAGSVAHACHYGGVWLACFFYRHFQVPWVPGIYQHTEDNCGSQVVNTLPHMYTHTQIHKHTLFILNLYLQALTRLSTCII